MVITSVNNPLIKEIKSLKNEKGFLFLDNPKLISEAFGNSLKIKYLIFEEGKETQNFAFENINKIIVSKSVFKTIKTTESSQGVCAVVLFENKVFKPPSGNFLVLDEVQDPGNVGTLIRSALAFGFRDIYLIDCANITNEKVVRSTMGALFKTNVYSISRIEFIKNFAKENLYCGTMDGEDVRHIKPNVPAGIVVGNEGKGVSKEVKEICKKVAIKMEKGVESLNAAVAGGILMFEFHESFIKEK